MPGGLRLGCFGRAGITHPFPFVPLDCLQGTRSDKFELWLKSRHVRLRPLSRQPLETQHLRRDDVYPENYVQEFRVEGLFLPVCASLRENPNPKIKLLPMIHLQRERITNLSPREFLPIQISRPPL